MGSNSSTIRLIACEAPHQTTVNSRTESCRSRGAGRNFGHVFQDAKSVPILVARDRQVSTG